MSSQLSNWGTYFKSLIPGFKKKDIHIDLAHCFEELEKIIDPMYNGGHDAIKFEGSSYAMTDMRFKKLLSKYNGNPFKTIGKTIVTTLDNCDDITEEVNNSFKDDNLKVIFDYYQLNLLKYIEGITFFNDYARRWINVVIYETLAAKGTVTSLSGQEEMSTLNKGDTTGPMVISGPTFRGDAEYINDPTNLEMMTLTIELLSMPFDKYLKSIEELKGHTYSDSDWGKSESITTKKLDPHQHNFLPVMLNPVYHIGIALNGWRIQKYERNKAEFARLQLMLMALHEQKTKNSNPEKLASLEKQINYYSNLSNKCSAKIEDMEERG